MNAPRAQRCPGGGGDHMIGFLVDGLFPGGTWTTSAVVYAFTEELIAGGDALDRSRALWHLLNTSSDHAQDAR